MTKYFEQSNQNVIFIYIFFKDDDTDYFPLAYYNKMIAKSIGRILILVVLITYLSKSSIIDSSSTSKSAQPPQIQTAAFFTTITSVNDISNVTKILSQLAVPGFSRKHGFNYIAFDGWSCSRNHGVVLQIWKNPNKYLNDSLGANNNLTRKVIKNFYQAAGIKILVNVFSSFQNPVSQNQDSIDCSNKLLAFIQQYDLDGANIDFQDLDSLKMGSGIIWLTQFLLNLHKNTNDQLIYTHTVDANFFDASQYPQGDYSLIQKVVGKNIRFYNIKYFADKFGSFKDIFKNGALSVNSLVSRGIPLNKIVVGKPSLYNATGFVRPNLLLNIYKKANGQLNWWGGAMFSPYIDKQSQDETRLVTLRRDNIEVISAVGLDSLNFWWPPQKTASDIGVPGYAPDNMYNTFIFGTWTCKAGAFDISKLWADASFYLSTNFGNNTYRIQQFLKKKYESKGKNILVRAFGNAQSPTSGNLDPTTCAKGLASFIKNNNLDGVDVNYQDNVAFNSAIAQRWLITFTNILRNLLPFHIISHSIQQYLLDRTKYKGGSYTKVISTVGDLLDYYTIKYYGQQHTSFTSYQDLFFNSGTQFNNVSVTQLVSQGFDINKIVIGKPVRLFDAQGVGFIQPQQLRQIFLQANAKLGWKGGISYSSYINDQDGTNLLMLLRGITKGESKRFVYVDNVKIWWPPQSTLAQMGVPTLAANNSYNYFAYTFWTCKDGPLAMSKVYNDPLTYLGTNLGQSKSQIQTYMKNLFQENSVKLLVSAFGASENPDNESLSACECGAKFVEFIDNNKLDGIDIDYEDSYSFIKGTGQQWVNVFTRQIRRSKPFHIITHAPQAPYFSSQFAQTGSYLTIHSAVGKFIDFYNIQFYNQGNSTPYDTYQNLFVDSGIYNSNTSVFQIISQGIEAQKVVLGKPVTQTDAYNTGYLPSSELKNIVKRAVNDPNNPKWTPSFMYWQYLSDLQGSSIGEVLSYNK